MKPEKIAIIGGQGLMGSMFATAFKEKGYEVLVSGQNSKFSNKDIAAAADVVIISVPIRVTASVIEEIAPVIKADSLLTDFTSVKCNPLRKMQELNLKCDIIGGHPLFGPVSSMQKQNFILCPVQGNRYLSWYKELLGSFGLNVLEMTPEDHDRQMGVIQCLIHLSNLSLANTLRRLNFNITNGEAIASPIYQLRMHIIGRILAQDPKLYTDIEFENPFAKEMAQEYITSAQELEKLIVENKKTEFENMFKKVADFFGLEAQHSLSITNKIIEMMGDLEETS